MKKTILSAVFTAICWISLCLDWDILMYLSGLTAMILFGLDDLKIQCRAVAGKFHKSGAERFIRKEMVKA